MEPRVASVAAPVALLVDDGQDSRKTNQARLEQQGYAVLVAQNGADALSRAKQSSPQVIFTHLAVGGPDNLKLLQALRSDDGCRHIPVVVIRDSGPVRPALMKLRTVPREG
jgi:CheY-like chemotaxis protein